MFNEELSQTSAPVEEPITKPKSTYVPFLNGVGGNAYISETSYTAIDQMLENEKIRNKKDPWNRLDKMSKIQKLHSFSEKYGKEHALPAKEIKLLKQFFLECLNKGKLQKTKDVVYDKETQELSSVPSLFFNSATKNFTLRIVDAKRVSTLKSLTPKRVSEKNKEDIAALSTGNLE